MKAAAKAWGLVLAALAISLFCAAQSASAQSRCSSELLSGVRPEFQRESVYNVMFVRRAGPCASLTFRRGRGDWLESMSNLEDPSELPVAYTRTMTLGLAYAAHWDSMLAIGLGAGTLPGYLSTALAESELEAVELDPEVLDLARNYFGLARMERSNLTLHESDGRIYLRNNHARYDLIFLDAYRGGYIPEHLTTREFYSLVKSRLNPGGVVVANLHAGTAFFDSTVATYRAVFARADLYRAGGNVILIAGDQLPPPEALRARAREISARLRLRYNLSLLLYSGYEFEPARNTRILSDDFSPSNLLEAIESANQARP